MSPNISQAGPIVPQYLAIFSAFFRILLDPVSTPPDRSRGQTAHSKMTIDACKPFAWKGTFAPVSALASDEGPGTRCELACLVTPE